MREKLWQSVLSTVSIAIGIGCFTPTSIYAQTKLSQPQDFVNFKYLNEFTIAHPKKWIVEPTGKNSNCHIYPTDSTVCTFAYMYSSKTNSTSREPLKNFIKTDIVIEFSPMNKTKTSRSKKLQIGELPAYRQQGMTEEGDFERMNYLSTSIAYKNRVIQLSTYFSDIKHSQLVKIVHDSFRILR